MIKLLCSKKNLPKFYMFIKINRSKIFINLLILLLFINLKSSTINDKQLYIKIYTHLY